MPIFICWNCGNPCILYICEIDPQTPEGCPWGVEGVKWTKFMGEDE